LIGVGLEPVDDLLEDVLELETDPFLEVLGVWAFALREIPATSINPIRHIFFITLFLIAFTENVAGGKLLA